jgi:hypothetical protein
MHDEPVTRVERAFYMSTVGSMLFVGHITSPIAARMAGILASAIPDLSVKNIKILKAAVRKLHSGLPAIAELFTSLFRNQTTNPFGSLSPMQVLVKTFRKSEQVYLSRDRLTSARNARCMLSISVRISYGASRVPPRRPKLWPRLRDTIALIITMLYLF